MADLDYTIPDEERKRQGWMALARGSAGLLGARKGQEWGALGNGMQQGLLSLNQQQQDWYAQQAQKQRMAIAQQEMAIRQQDAQQRNDEMRRQVEDRARMQGATQGAMVQPFPSMGPPTAQGAMSVPQAQFDPQRFAANVEQFDPFKAAAYRQSLAKESPFDRPKPEHFTPESREEFARTGNWGALRAPVPTAKDSWIDVPPPAGSPPGLQWQRDVVSGQLGGVGLPAPVTNDNVSTGAGEKAFTGEYGKLQASALVKEQEAAQRAADTIVTVHQARNAMSDGAIQGGLASQKQAFLSTIKGLGFRVDDKTLANTGKLNSAMGQFVLQHAKDLGTNPSNADAARIERIVGTIDTDPGALTSLLDFMESGGRKTIQRYNGKAKQAMGNPSTFVGYDPTVQEPPAWQAPAAAEKPMAPAPRLEIEYAKQAIKRGANREAVIKRMRERGYSADGL